MWFGFIVPATQNTTRQVKEGGCCLSMGKLTRIQTIFLIVCINHHQNIFFAASFSRDVAFKMKVLQNFGMLNIILFFCGHMMIITMCVQIELIDRTHEWNM
ncbi:hypothetical protein ACKWTF_006799 [Chironomus riparius]